MSGLLRRLVGRRKDDPAAGYDDAKRLARHDDPAVRRELAARDDVAPEILYYLAEDADPAVRQVIAGNDAAPRQADLLLARDENDAVRAELARKIGRLAPELSARERDQLEDLTVEALDILGRDALPQIRQIIAEEIKRLDTVPKALVEALAQDLELIVAAPILEYSPLLNDTDLLEIINSAPVQGALTAISRRDGLDESVADAIAAGEDADAIAALLANDSAQIREETLDSLIDRAPDHESWHEPLVLRPHLSARAVRRISRFVTAALLAELEQRHGLDPTVTREVAERVDERLADPDGEAAKAAADEARDMFEQGQLDEAHILDRLGGGDREFLTHAIALRAEVTPLTVKRVWQSKSPKGITALIWKAGLTMRAAIEFQTKVAGVNSHDILYAKDGTEYPLDEQEMTWRLQMFDA